MGKMGFNKLLSQGKVLNKFKIKVDCASKKAVEKIKSGGGVVDFLEEKETSIKNEQPKIKKKDQ